MILNLLGKDLEITDGKKKRKYKITGYLDSGPVMIQLTPYNIKDKHKIITIK